MQSETVDVRANPLVRYGKPCAFSWKRALHQRPVDLQSEALGR